MATESIGLPFEATSAAAWLVWILPFAAALIMPGIGKFSKKEQQVTSQLDLH